jgi:hypothetical protein
MKNNRVFWEALLQVLTRVRLFFSILYERALPSLDAGGAVARDGTVSTGPSGGVDRALIPMFWGAAVPEHRVRLAVQR